MTVPSFLARFCALWLNRDASRWSLATAVALAAFLSAAAVIGLTALDGARRDWERVLGGVLTVQLPAETSQARLDVVLAMVRQTQGVTTARLLASADTARLLEPWLGKSVAVDILPLPRLVDVGIEPHAGLDLAGLRQRLKSLAPDAQLDDHRAWLAGLIAESSRLQHIGVAVVVVAALVAALSASGTIGSSFARSRDRILLLHMLGADDRDIAVRFVMPVAASGVIGGAFGALAAAALWTTLANAAASLQLPLVVPAVTDWPALLLFAATILASGVIPGSAAALSARRRLLQLP